MLSLMLGSPGLTCEWMDERRCVPPEPPAADALTDSSSLRISKAFYSEGLPIKSSTGGKRGKPPDRFLPLHTAN